MTVLRALAAFVVLAAVFAPAAGAVPLALSDGSALFTTDTNSLNSTSLTVISGMQPGEVLAGIDQRPATGELYGIGSTSRLYRLDPVTATATQVGTAGGFTLNGTRFGIDFAPVTDRLRVVSDTEQNLLLNPDTGTVSTTGSALSPAGTVLGAAYTGNVAGAVSATLYDIDSGSGELLRQGSVNGSPQHPDGGMLTTVGTLGLGSPLNDQIGFDIGADGSNLATITTGGVSRLYGINLGSGLATNLGTIGNGATSYRGLAIMPARIRLASSTAAAAEGGTATFDVVRNAPAAGPVSVDYATAPGTATSGEDFSATNGTVTWGAGESGTRSITVPIAADSPAEGDETFSLSLSNVTGANAVFGVPTTSTATIAANEAGPALQFAAAAVTAAEGGSASLSVVRVGSTAHPVSVDYTTAPGLAGASDFTPASGTLSWAAGDGTAKTIAIPIADDAAEEGEEIFGISLLNPAGGATLGSPAAATVAIAASDPAVLGPPLPPPAAPALTLKLAGTRKQALRTVRRRGLALAATVNLPCTLTVTARKRGARVGRSTRSLAAGTKTLRIRLARSQRRRLRAGQKLTASATCATAAATTAPVRRTVKITARA